jgi:hypothetical protein
VLAHDLNGDVKIEYRPEGINCSFDIPWADATATLGLMAEARPIVGG